MAIWRFGALRMSIGRSSAPGTITLKPWVALRLGYRSLNVTASGSDFGYTST
jgi:hypothetical protein